MTLGLSPEMYFVALAVAAIAAVPGYGIAAKALALVLVLILHVNWPMVQALWVYRHIPTARTPLPFVGNLLDIIGTKGQIHVKYREWQKEHGPVFKVFLGLSPAIVACELDLCREITLRRAQCFNIRPTPGPKGQAALSKEQQHQNQTGIFNTQNARLWKGLRSNANSIFHSADHLASFSPLMKETALELADKLSKVPEGKPVDIWRCFGDMTLDVVGSTVFGVRFRSVESEEGAEAVKACRTIFKHNLLSPLVNPYVQIASLAPGFLVPAVAWCAERWPTAAMRELKWAGDILRRVTVEVYDYAAGEVQGEGERAEKEESLWGPAFEDEFDDRLSHSGPGILSMANAGAGTNKRQFFLTYKSCAHLDRKHSVFGKIVKGLDVLRAMEAVPTGKADRPTEDIKIVTAEIMGTNPVTAAAKAERERIQERAEARMKEKEERKGGAIGGAALAANGGDASSDELGNKKHGGGVGKYLPKNMLAQSLDDLAATGQDISDGKRKKKKLAGATYTSTSSDFAALPGIGAAAAASRNPSNKAPPAKKAKNWDFSGW